MAACTPPSKSEKALLASFHLRTVARKLQDCDNIVLMLRNGTGLSFLRAFVEGLPSYKFYSIVAKAAESIGSQARRLAGQLGEHPAFWIESQKLLISIPHVGAATNTIVAEII